MHISSDRAQLSLSRHAQSRMAQRSVSPAEVQQCVLHGRWMRNQVSGKVLNCASIALLHAM